MVLVDALVGKQPKDHEALRPSFNEARGEQVDNKGGVSQARGAVKTRRSSRVSRSGVFRSIEAERLDAESGNGDTAAIGVAAEGARGGNS